MLKGATINFYCIFNESHFPNICTLNTCNGMYWIEQNSFSLWISLIIPLKSFWRSFFDKEELFKKCRSFYLELILWKLSKRKLFLLRMYFWKYVFVAFHERCSNICSSNFTIGEWKSGAARHVSEYSKIKLGLWQYS